MNKLTNFNKSKWNLNYLTWELEIEVARTKQIKSFVSSLLKKAINSFKIIQTREKNKVNFYALILSLQ